MVGKSIKHNFVILRIIFSFTLQQVECCLSRVEQSPIDSMQNALSPSLKALIADKLLRHSDDDVKIAVASCISEITRITAPEAPYDDDQMKVSTIFFYYSIWMDLTIILHSMKDISKSIEFYWWYFLAGGLSINSIFVWKSTW